MNANVNGNASAVQDASGCSEDADSSRDANLKRTGCLDWDEYFMAICFLAAMRSKDPSTQVGACIVDDDRKIVGIGYNGMPLGCSDDRLPWCKGSADGLDAKYLYVCHAEMNAVINKNSADVKGCTIYVALFPCNECAKLIIQSGIREVVYASDKHKHRPSTIASKRLFDMAGLKYRQYVPVRRQVVIDFDVIDSGGRSRPAHETGRPETDGPGTDGPGTDGVGTNRPGTNGLVTDGSGTDGPRTNGPGTMDPELTDPELTDPKLMIRN